MTSELGRYKLNRKSFNCNMYVSYNKYGREGARVHRFEHDSRSCKSRLLLLASFPPTSDTLHFPWRGPPDGARGAQAGPKNIHPQIRDMNVSQVTIQKWSPGGGPPRDPFKISGLIPIKLHDTTFTVNLPRPGRPRPAHTLYLSSCPLTIKIQYSLSSLLEIHWFIEEDRVVGYSNFGRDGDY